MRRMMEDDAAKAQQVVGQIDLAMQSLRSIDLRTYGGDPELREKVQQAKNDLKDARGRLREALALKWRR